MADDVSKTAPIEMTTKLVSSFVSNNPIDPRDLPDLKVSVHSTMSQLDSPSTDLDRPAPAAPINKSITQNQIICLEDGKKLKMLKRYIRTRLNLSPDEYRARWGLPADYPMVAPEYAKRRSKFAKDIGPGKKTS
ncbi:MAG: MucR family transcriptional regulator [Pseudomonadota bacterium]